MPLVAYNSGYSYKMQQTNENKRERKWRERTSDILELPPHDTESSSGKNTRKVSMATPQISIQEATVRFTHFYR